MCASSVVWSVCEVLPFWGCGASRRGLMVGFVANSARSCLTGSGLVLGSLRKVSISLGIAFKKLLIRFRRPSGVGTFDIKVVCRNANLKSPVTPRANYESIFDNA